MQDYLAWDSKSLVMRRVEDKVRYGEGVDVRHKKELMINGVLESMK